MMHVWSHRPSFLHLGLFIGAYVLGCGFAQLLAIVPGTGISIWPPAGLFIATLVLAPRPSWPWWILGGCLAELFGNFLWFHSPLPAAFLIYTGNALEAAVGAWLINRTCRQPVRLESLQEVLAFVALGAGIAPMVSATVGSATLVWFGIQSQSFVAAWPLWWIGDATGVLVVAPLALVVFQNWRGKARLSAARWVEAGVLALIFLGVAALSLSGYLPFAYIIMPPLLWAAVRFEFKGAAVALILLALITAVFTISGGSQFAGDPESQKHKQVMLHLFLAVSAFSALIVAAISRQHQQALLTLRESERSLRELVETLPAHIWCTTADGEPIYFSRQFRNFIGFNVGDKDVDGASRLSGVLNAIIHPDDLGMVSTVFADALATGESFALKHRQRRFDGQYRWVETRAAAMRNSDDAIVQWNGVSFDVHDLVIAQEALRDRERELSQLVDIVPSLLWRLSPDGEPVFFNKRMVEFFGLDVGDYDKPGMSGLEAAIAALVHPDDATRLGEVLNHSFVTGESFSLNYRLRRADGVYRWMSGRGAPLRDESGRILQWYGSCHDIDDQAYAEEALRRASDKLAGAAQAASLAELSASIAHEVNQPLAAIVANSHACHRWLSAEPPNVERAKITVERIVRDANSAADVVSRIRALFRQSVERRNSAALPSVLEEVRNLMAGEAARRHVRMDVEIENGLPLVAFDRVQVQQVLINLIRNATEAMDAVMGARVLGVRVRRMGDVVRTEISDRGPGVEFPDKIFEPFFTTKEHGMGMGLAICRSIVESHGGRLWAERNEPQGATFIFTLPVEVRTPP